MWDTRPLVTAEDKFNKIPFLDTTVWCIYKLKRLWQSHKARTRLSQTGSQHWDGWVETGVLLLTKKLSVIDTHWQSEDELSSNGVSLGASTTLQGKPHTQEQPPNTKQIQWFIWALLVLLFLCFDFFLCGDVLVLSFLFFVKEQRANIRLGGYRVGEQENMSKKFYVKWKQQNLDSFVEHRNPQIFKYRCVKRENCKTKTCKQ